MDENTLKYGTPQINAIVPSTLISTNGTIADTALVELNKAAEDHKNSWKPKTFSDGLKFLTQETLSDPVQGFDLSIVGLSVQPVSFRLDTYSNLFSVSIGVTDLMMDEGIPQLEGQYITVMRKRYNYSTDVATPHEIEEVPLFTIVLDEPLKMETFTAEAGRYVASAIYRAKIKSWKAHVRLEEPKAE